MIPAGDCCSSTTFSSKNKRGEKRKILIKGKEGSAGLAQTGTSARVHLPPAPRPAFVFGGVSPLPLSLPEPPHQDTSAGTRTKTGTWGAGAGNHQLCLDASLNCPIRLLNHLRKYNLLPLPLFFTRTNAGITHSRLDGCNTVPERFQNVYSVNNC